MELEFQKTQLSCMQTVLYKQQSKEQTQEVRISDGMPDIDTVLDTWGQVILRGKEWDRDMLTVTGGTMVWVRYRPEGGGKPQIVEGWLPFQVRFPAPEGERDGVMLLQCNLKSVDCRSVSARKLMFRSNVCVLLQALQRQQILLYQPEAVPEDVQLHTVEYPVLLPAEAGERTFELEEMMPPPAGNRQITRIVATQLQPQITENRIISDKVIFRGSALVTLLVEDEDGLRSVCYDLPFSQYSELDQSYGDDATATLWPGVTALDAEVTEDGIRINAGLVCQYEVRHRPLIRIVDDAYSPIRPVELVSQTVSLPGILESKSRTLHAVGVLEGVEGDNVQMLPQSPEVENRDGGVAVKVPVSFQGLCRDMEDGWRLSADKWEETVTLPADTGIRMDAVLWPVGRLQTSSQGGDTRVQGDVLLQTQTRLDAELPMVTGLKLGQEVPPDPERPSLILRRAGSDTLWQIAKATGSVASQIQSLNGLTGEPDPEQMLLIPVK